MCFSLMHCKDILQTPAGWICYITDVNINCSKQNPLRYQTKNHFIEILMDYDVLFF